MTSEWIAAVFGVLGTAVGAGATLAANWIATRTQLKLASEDQRQRRAEVRRAASVEYLIAADSFIDSARELVSKMESAALGTECFTAHESYFASWEDLQRKRGPVIIAGPDELGRRADELYSRLGALGDECDGWYSAYMNGERRTRASAIDNVQGMVRDARAEFIKIAQKNAHQESGKSSD